MTENPLLRACLSAAVPLYIARLRGWPWSALAARAEELGVTLASTGDAVLFARRGTARAFNVLAEALACAAHAPGGVSWMGLHFEAGEAERGRWKTECSGRRA